MKKMLKSALALAMGAVMLMPVTAFAAEDEPTPRACNGYGAFFIPAYLPSF